MFSPLKGAEKRISARGLMEDLTPSKHQIFGLFILKEIEILLPTIVKSYL